MGVAHAAPIQTPQSQVSTLSSGQEAQRSANAGAVLQRQVAHAQRLYFIDDADGEEDDKRYISGVCDADKP